MPEHSPTPSSTPPRGLPGAQKLADAHHSRPAPTPTPDGQPTDDVGGTSRLRAYAGNAPIEEPDAPKGLPHGDSWLTRSCRAAARLAYTDTFPAAFTEAVDACQAPVTTGRRIGVLSPTGGAGASTITAAMASFFALVRTDLTTSLDLTAPPSGLVSRLPTPDDEALPSGLGHVPKNPDAQDSLDVTEFGPCPRQRLLRLTYAPDDQPLAAESVAGLQRELSRSRSIAVSEIPRPSSPPQVDVSGFHCLVIVMSPASGSLDANAETLRAVHRQVPGIPLVPVLVDSRRVSRRQMARAEARVRRALTALELEEAVLRVSYDRHLATGAELRIGRIGELRRLQVARLCASALETAMGKVS